MKPSCRRPVRLHLGKFQVSGLEIYITDPAHDEPFPAAVDWKRNQLSFCPAMRDMIFNRITEAANSADDDHDMEIWRALTALGSRVLRSR